MTISGKKTVLSMFSGVLMVIAYIIYALGGSAPEPGNVKSWALAMLIFIGIGVILAIVIEIFFHIALSIVVSVKENEGDSKKVERVIKSSMLEDERDKLIGLKSARLGYVCAGAGFIAALVLLAFGVQAVAALHTIFASFAAGSLAEGIMGVYYHEKGVGNG